MISKALVLYKKPEENCIAFFHCAEDFRYIPNRVLMHYSSLICSRNSASSVFTLKKKIHLKYPDDTLKINKLSLSF